MSATSHVSQRASWSTSASSGPTKTGSAPVVMRSRRCAVGSLKPVEGVLAMLVLSRSADRSSVGIRDGALMPGGPRGEHPPDRALVQRRVAELLLADDDAPQEPVRRVL